MHFWREEKLYAVQLMKNFGETVRLEGLNRLIQFIFEDATNLDCRRSERGFACQWNQHSLCGLYCQVPEGLFDEATKVMTRGILAASLGVPEI